MCDMGLQDAQAMFDSSMSAAAIAQRVQELQAAAGIKAQLVTPPLQLDTPLHAFSTGRLLTLVTLLLYCMPSVLVLDVAWVLCFVQVLCL